MASFDAPRLLSVKESCTKVLGYCAVPDSDHILITHDSKVALMQVSETVMPAYIVHIAVKLPEIVIDRSEVVLRGY